MITNLVVKLSLTGAGQAVMWFLVGLSVVSMAIAIERALFFKKHGGKFQELAGELNALFTAGEYAKAKKLVEDDTGYGAQVLSAALDIADKGEGAVEEMAASASKMQKMRFQRGLAVLGTIGNNAPFIGLFGTVLEIVAALHELGENAASSVGAGAVMGTLSAALAATAVGLLVALPAVAFYNLFISRIKTMQVGADALVHVLVAHMKGDKHSA